MKKRYITPTDHTDWLRLRKNGIGGSDAAAVAGFNDYVSPYAVWLDKTGQTKDPDDPEEINEAMRQGTDLEEYVARRFCEKTGKKVRRNNRIIQNDIYPFAFANVDRWIVGENAGLECKTTSTLNLKKFKDGEFPVNYYLQCMHYMAVTGADKYYLAVLVFSKEFLVFEIERDQELIDDLMKVESDFWDCVKTKTPPPVDGTLSTDSALNDLYSDSTDTCVELFSNLTDLEMLMEAKQEKKEIEAKIKTYEQRIKESMKDAEMGEVNQYVVTWKPQTRSTFQVKDFIKDHPDMDLSEYYKTSTSRVFRVKELAQ